MRIAVFGGTFNPFHLGHAMLADRIVTELGYDKVLIVPSYIPPHKNILSQIDPMHRLGMVKAFCDYYNKEMASDKDSRVEPENDIESVSSSSCKFLSSSGLARRSLIEVETCEMDRGGVSYSYETITYLAEKYKSVLDGKLGFVLGDEAAAEFHKWKNPDVIAEKVDFIITHRYPSVDAMEKSLFSNKPSGEYKGDFHSKFDLKEFKYPCTYLSEPVLPVSSTEIRTKIAENRSWRYLVTEPVFNYINQYGLYRSN